VSSLSAQSLHKNERLHSKNDIDRLLSKGRFFVVDNVFRCCVLPRPASGSGVAAAGAGVTGVAGSGVTGVPVENGSASDARMMVSVPKKCFKRAVKRNLLKRRIREAYRRNKPSLPMDILFVYLPKEILSYEQIEQTLIRAIERAEEKLRTCAPAAAVVGASSPALSPNSGSQTGASQREVSQHEVSQREVSQREVSQNKFVAVLKWIGNAPFLLLISFYRACVSPFTPPACRFTPTCSQYAMEAFKKYGPFKGLYLTVKRILRCRPGGGSGYDPVP
jgi:putative membrane protein insertion efficiency factor/ribonuclease P protein component